MGDEDLMVKHCMAWEAGAIYIVLCSWVTQEQGVESAKIVMPCGNEDVGVDGY